MTRCLWASVSQHFRGVLFICRKSIKIGSSGSYSWTPRSLKTRHQAALEHQRPLTWWRSTTLQTTSNLNYCMLQLYSTKPAGEITSSHSMKFHVRSYHLTFQSTIIHPAMSQERAHIRFMLCSNVTSHFRWIWPDKFCIFITQCYISLHNLCGKNEKGKTEQGV